VLITFPQPVGKKLIFKQFKKAYTVEKKSFIISKYYLLLDFVF